MKGRLLWQEDGLDVGKNTASGDGDARHQLVQLLVVSDGQLKVTGDDPDLLVVTGSVASQLKDLGSQVLQDSGKEDGSSRSNAAGIASFLQDALDSSDWELELRFGTLADLLGSDLSSFAFSGHDGGLLPIDVWSGVDGTVVQSELCLR